MRYPASEKLEIIRLVEQSHLPAGARSTSSAFRATFYRWYDRFLTGGVEALEDRRPRPTGSGTAFPTTSGIRSSTLALEQPELSPRELAVTFTDTEGLFCLGGFGLSPAQGP
jgi:putative transposase